MLPATFLITLLSPEIATSVHIIISQCPTLTRNHSTMATTLPGYNVTHNHSRLGVVVRLRSHGNGARRSVAHKPGSYLIHTNPITMET